jgi:heavy metal efflux system protein
MPSDVKGVNVIKVYGPDLMVDERAAKAVREVVTQVPGIVDVAVYRAMGQPNLLIISDREICSRYGLNVGDVGAAVQTAIGGQPVTQVLQGDRRFDRGALAAKVPAEL